MIGDLRPLSHQPSTAPCLLTFTKELAGPRRLEPGQRRTGPTVQLPSQHLHRNGKGFDLDGSYTGTSAPITTGDYYHFSRHATPPSSEDPYSNCTMSPFQPGCGREPARLSGCAVDGPAGDAIYGVLGDSVSCRRGAGGSGVGAPVSGAARNASIT